MRIIPVILALALGFAATPALAEYLDIEDVRDMALDKGIVELEKIELNDGKWKVKGKDEYGDKIKMEVDAQTGRITKMERN